jgi:HD-like signal output (HDOD) protein
MTGSLARARLCEGVVEELWSGEHDIDLSEAEAARSMASQAAVAAALKPFPAPASRLRAVLERPSFVPRDARAHIERSPALAERLLRVANSAAFRPLHPYASIEDVTARLDPRAIAEIVTGMAAIELFTDDTALAALVRDHSVSVAAIARVLGVEWRVGGVAGVFLTAILHDVGKLLLLHVDPVVYSTFDPELFDVDDAVHLFERRAYGYDHAALGAHVLRHWAVPEPVVRGVAWHHQPGRAFEHGGDLGATVALVRLANRLEYRLRYEFELDEGFLESVAATADAAYTDYDAHFLGALWPKMVVARHELRAALLR